VTIDLDPKAAGLDPARLARIDHHLASSYVDPGKIAGCQVLVARHGHVAHRATLGQMDRERGVPVADDAIWRWYSMTKPVTGVALLALVEQGLCKLTDPVHRYLPEWRDVQVAERQPNGPRQRVAPRRPMELRDAMMHMTGIGFGPPEARLDLTALANGEGGARRLDPSATLRDLSRLLAQEPLRFHPGEHWLYSWSTDICAALVEVISGRTFGDQLRETIFEPLGMVDTGFSVRADAADRVAALYARNAAKELVLVDDPAKGRLLREPALQSGAAAWSARSTTTPGSARCSSTAASWTAPGSWAGRPSSSCAPTTSRATGS
jgi:CubicO group peptidase (beta-lactamase class C family)